jgi:hypothetical protein
MVFDEDKLQPVSGCFIFRIYVIFAQQGVYRDNDRFRFVDRHRAEFAKPGRVCRQAGPS